MGRDGSRRAPQRGAVPGAAPRAHASTGATGAAGRTSVARRRHGRVFPVDRGHRYRPHSGSPVGTGPPPAFAARLTLVSAAGATPGDPEIRLLWAAGAGTLQRF